MARFEHQIAIFGVAHEVAIIAVLNIDQRDIHMRHRTEQLAKLFKERSAEIEVPPVLQRIPRVRPPFTMPVDDRGTCGSEDREDLLAGQVGLTMVQVALIAMGVSALPAARGTVCRRGNQLLLPGKHGRYFLVEREVIIGDLKALPALNAYFLHQYTVWR